VAGPHFGPIAVEGHGNIDVAGVNGWSIWQVAPSGIAHEIGFARQTGGNLAVLQPGPNGTVYGENEDPVVRIAHGQLNPVLAFGKLVDGRPLGYFPLTYFVVSANGAVYADDLPGKTYQALTGVKIHQQLRSVRGGHRTLLWQAKKNAAP